MKLIKSLLLIFISLWACILHAQTDLEEIKNSRLYWSAEGQGVTIEEAENDALAQITRQIKSFVTSMSSETDNSGRDSHQTEYSSYQQLSAINVSTASISLQNVEKRVLSPEPDAKVFMWVSREEVKNINKKRKQKIIDFVEAGKTAEQRLQIDDALRNYYWALMLTKASGDVYAEFDGEERNCLSYLPMKIKSVMGNINARLEDCRHDANRYYATMHFTYGGNDVSSLQIHYFDGQSFVGPSAVKDGYGELDLLSLPSNGKLKLNYEYRFSNEAINLDRELEAVFRDIKAPIINSAVEIPVNIDIKKHTMAAKKKVKDGVSIMGTEDVAEIKPEPVTHKERMELQAVSSDECDTLIYILGKIEKAISKKKAQDAYGCFTVDGYKMFKTLIDETGAVTLVGARQKYEFIRGNAGQIIGRFCRIKIKFKDGKSFTEDLTFRFRDSDYKIESIAFALTRKAEDDIFNAASTWTEVSRFTILQFMEDYQTAYALKRLDYISQIFSDNAIIITGTMLKPASEATVEGMPIRFGDERVTYTRLSKQQFIDRLKKQFDERDYVHLTFEDNQTKVINAPRLPKGTAFAIQINQIYNSPTYSDKGYLTLVLDASQELPVIHVRLWQPDKADLMSLDEFMNNFEF